ncbi:TetR/AcrR family transcriptional regulator [Niallia sp. 03133]|uniref:TetR/AcrR family transcriptional regulator n=1 Tax=Niallia sp. 03133 TaxID=3458060 RepID=UPI004043FE38
MNNQNQLSQKREKKRKLILQAASEIIRMEGMEKLSIRKIAKKINSASSNIYHYFVDKEDIVNSLMTEGYRNIVHSLPTQDFIQNPKERLTEGLRTYIESALKNSDEYIGMLVNSSPVLLEHTSLLFEGASLKREALSMLYQLIKEMLPDDIEPSQLELIAQSVWTATFGLIIKLILEKDLPIEQRQKLMETHLSITAAGILVFQDQEK